MGMSDKRAVSDDLDLALASHAMSAKVQTADKDQRLLTIFEIAKILATQQDLETMLSEFLSCLIETLEAAEAGTLLLYNPSDGQLTVRAAQGYDLANMDEKAARKIPFVSAVKDTYEEYINKFVQVIRIIPFSLIIKARKQQS